MAPLLSSLTSLVNILQPWSEAVARIHAVEICIFVSVEEDCIFIETRRGSKRYRDRLLSRHELLKSGNAWMDLVGSRMIDAIHYLKETPMLEYEEIMEGQSIMDDLNKVSP